MPYTIALSSDHDPHKLLRDLDAAVRASRFTARFELGRRASRRYRAEIIVKPVRLKEKKLYCGQHPGSCAVAPKRRGTWLEWDDWVDFHRVINDLLTAKKVTADVWSNPAEPLDKGKKMWIRRGDFVRVAYDWHDDPADTLGGVFRNPRRIWNHGTPDQFIPTYWAKTSVPTCC